MRGAGRRAIAGRPVEGVTASDGAWRLDAVPGGRIVLRVEHVAYAPVERRLDAARYDGTPLELRLTPRPVMLSALVVTAGRRLQRLADVPVATELVTSREIRETGATDLASVLTERTGIEIQGGHPAGTGVMIQGFGSERVLVLLDGQPFIGRLSGSIDLSRIPTSMIERIEVVKGPQSTLYGSEAMGGVVNVITRSPDGPTWTTSANLTAGDQGRVDVSGNVVGGVGGLTGLVDVGRRSVDLAPGWMPGTARCRAGGWAGEAGWRTPLGVAARGERLLLDERQRWRAGQLYHSWTTGSGGVGRGVGARPASALRRSTPRRSTTVAGSAARGPGGGTGESETQRLVEGERCTRSRWATCPGRGDRSPTRGGPLDRVVGGRRETTRSGVRADPLVGPGSTRPRRPLQPERPLGTHWTPRLAAMYRPTQRPAVRASPAQASVPPRSRSSTWSS